VFEGTRGNYSETDQPAPANFYAQTKLEGEQVALATNDVAAIARVTIYGWNVQSKHSLAEWIFEQLRSGHTVAGFTDVVFCPILANDLAEILLAMTAQKLTGIFHVVGSEAVSKYEFARRVAQVFQFDPAKVVSSQLAQAKLKAPRPRDVSLNTEKICARLGRSMPDVNSGLRRFARLRPEGYMERLRGEVMGVRE
jgi:dTDP-4-dehydrorhamnose reductase